MDKKEIKYRIAVGTSDGIVVNQHFGRASVFLIYDIQADDTIHYVERRETRPVCNGGTHDDEKLKESAERLSDCRYVLVSRIGSGAANLLEQNGISPMELPGMIEDSIKKLLVYEEIQSLLL